MMKWGIRLAIASAGLVLLALTFVLLWKGPWIFDGSHLRKKDLQPADGVVITGFRTMVVAILASIFAGLGLAYTHVTLQHTREKDREQAALTREGQMTDRYATAIELLASQELTKRLGGIYALERIMRDSPKDHESIVEVLAAFVREHAPRPEQDDSVESEREQASMHEHVQAALTVLGRRPERRESFAINLRHTDLRGAQLASADLRSVNLQGSFLEYAELKNADLLEANMEACHLEHCNLTGADLTSSNLERAYICEATLDDARLDHARLNYALVKGSSLVKTSLVKANLQGARFIGAVLDDADLTSSRMMVAKFTGTYTKGAKLDGALLHAADLSEADDLTVEQMLSARIEYSTKVPNHLDGNPDVMARLEAAEARARERARQSTGTPLGPQP
ncbi:pentapeptide repeat-containing protein [Streptomyces sp. NBC_00663]|uniref:pentapeptide repeat-containing protein n=1 Tax=Streptomyces sp. NBC_00663 TaxID=2975801 RepID=UPI002E38195D|nr:pentapeptide repeat-containing protein [Streptomyces sp. NBC_00663]